MGFCFDSPCVFTAVARGTTDVVCAPDTVDGISATPKTVRPNQHASKMLLSTASMRVHRSC